MKKEKTQLNERNDLRQSAEQRLKESGFANAGATESVNALALVHELQVHQIELEMQNEELRRVGQEAEEALAKYSDLYDFAPIGLFTLDEQGRILESNLTGAKILGVERRHLSKKSFQRFVTPKDRPIFDDFCKKAFATYVKQTCELLLLKKDEAPVYARIEGTATEDFSPSRKPAKPRECRIAVIDITETKLAEKALRQLKDELELRVQERTAELDESNRALRKSEERYRALAENSPDVIARFDRQMRHQYVNAASERVTGLPIDEVIGKTNSELGMPRETVSIIEKSLRNVLATGKSVTIEFQYNGPAGKGYYETRLVPEFTTNGSVESVLAVTRDITERKKAETELRAAKEAAEVAVEAKSDFMASMSHELRTPMNSVIGMTSILLDDGDLTAEQKDFIETIRLSGDALMIVINDILDFSKMESDKVVLEEQPFDLRGTIEEALELVNIKAVEKGLNLAYNMDASVPETIISDPARLRQILGNLLSNAIKFTDVGEVKLSVSSNQDEPREIHFAIQDTGIGIASEKLDLLFQPFSQIEPSSYGSESGTGLGLAISKKLVEMMNGRIWVESEPEIGSTFHFTIFAETIPGETTAHLSGVQPHLMGKHVLIVDDNKTNRRILGAYTNSWGMVPFVASTSHEALDWIKRGDTFDVAVLDMDMQDMDGLTLAGEIKKYNETLPLVLLTSTGKRVPATHALHLTKPIKPSQLHKVLTDVISRPQAQEPTKSNSANRRVQAGPLRILLAEDNASSQKVIMQMLKRLGYRADVVANGIEVCQALERQHYDIVLMDVRMPEMDGLEATRTICQRWPIDRPKVIAITAYALEGDRDKCLVAGMDDYITKPVKMDEMAKMLKRYDSSA